MQRYREPYLKGNKIKALKWENSESVTLVKFDKRFRYEVDDEAPKQEGCLMINALVFKKKEQAFESFAYIVFRLDKYHLSVLNAKKKNLPIPQMAEGITIR